MEFKDLLADLPQKDLWTYLTESNKPIIMYGMGNGADKICDVLAKYSLEVSDYFASDDFVRGQSFRGKRVLTFDEVKHKYDNFIILVSFGTKLDDVIEKLVNISKQYELYLPDVPVAGNDIFDYEFFNKNISKIETSFSLLADEYSKKLYSNVIKYKLSGKIEYILDFTEDTSATISKLFSTGKWNSFLDLGAYNGDTIRETLRVAPNLSKIIAFEPDIKNHRKLSSYLNDLDVDTEVHNLCAWNERATLLFDSSGNRNSTVSTINHTASVGDTKKVLIEADSVDNILNGRSVDYINYDVEGAEALAIEGSIYTLKKYEPDLLIAAYHRSEDIFELLLTLSEVLPKHNFFLRRKKCLPAWELNIFATKNKG